MKTLIVEINREKEKLRINIFEKGTETTLSHYSEKIITDREIDDLCDDIVELLNKANKQGQLSEDLSNGLTKNGQLLYDQLLTVEVKDKIRTTDAKFLVFSLDEQLVHIPWELLFDGEEFLCLKFAVGRSVRTKQRFYEARYRSVSPPFQMLVMADPLGDLKSAYNEGIAVRNDLDKKKDKVKVDLKTTEVDTKFVKKNLRDYDIVHFAGHADYDLLNPSKSGWILSDGKFTAEDVVTLGSSAPLPSLIFSNACQSGKTQKWDIEKGFENTIYGLANAFLLAGVKHYIGSFWRVLDESCLLFAQEFYRNIINGEAIGEAVRLSRLKLIEKYGKTSIIWASYMLYGDPSTSLFTPISKVVPVADKPPKSKRLVLAGFVLLVLLLGIQVYKNFFKKEFPQLTSIEVPQTIPLEESIAVLPFENLNQDKENNWVGEGIADIISTKLSILESLYVVDKIKIREVWSGLTKGKELTEEKTLEVARILGAEKIIVGSFQKLGDDIRIIARLVNPEDAKVLDTAEVQGKYAEIFHLQDMIAFKLLDKLNIKIADEEKIRFEETIPTKSFTAFKYYSEGTTAYNEGVNDKAIELFEKSLEIDPNFAQPVHFLANIYERIGKLDLAKQQFERYKNLGEQVGDTNAQLLAISGISRLMIRREQYEKALVLLEKALTLARNSKNDQAEADILIRMISPLFSKGQKDKALQNAIEAKKIAEKSGNELLIAEACKALSILYLTPDFSDKDKSIKDKVVSLLNRAISIQEILNDKDRLSHTYSVYGLYYEIIGKPNDALVYHNRGLNLATQMGNKPFEALFYTRLASVYTVMNQIELAIEYDQKALDLYKELNDKFNYAYTLNHMAFLWGTQFRSDKQMEIYKEVVSLGKNGNDTKILISGLRNIADLYRQMGNCENAIKNYKEAEILVNKAYDKVTTAYIYLGLGICYGKIDLPEKAKEYFEDSIKIASETNDKNIIGYIYSNIGDAYKNRDTLDYAKPYYLKAISNLEELDFYSRNNSTLELAYFNLAESYSQEKQHEEARTYYEKALTLGEKIKSPLLPSIKYKIYSLSQEEKKEEEEFITQDAKVLFDEASQKHWLGEFDEALKLLEKAREIEPTSRKVLELTTLVYERVGRYEEAIKTHLEYIDLLDKDSEKAEIAERYAWIGSIYLNNWENEEAKQYYDKALELAHQIEDKKILSGIYCDVSNLYLSLDEDKAIEYANKGIELSKEVFTGYSLVNAYRTLSIVHSRKNDTEKAIEFAKLSLDIAEKMGSPLLGKSYALLGDLYKKTDVIKSIQYYQKAEEHFQSIHQVRELGNMYYQLAEIYKEVSQNNKAIEYYKKSLNITESLNDKGTTMASYMALSNLYHKLGSSDLSKEYEEKAIKLSKAIGEGKEYGLYLGILGYKYMEKDSQKAIKYFEDSIAILQNYEDDFSITNMELAYGVLSLIYGYHKKQYDKAIEYAKEMLDLAQKYNHKERILLATHGLGLLYWEQKNIEEALKYYKDALLVAIEIKDKDSEATIKEKIESILESSSIEDVETGAEEKKK